MKQNEKQKLILIGSGMVGARFLERLLKEAPDTFDIRVFNKEPNAAYNRIMLSPVLSGELSVPEIMTHDYDWFKKHAIHLHTGTAISEIDSRNKIVITDLGASYAYDTLIVATGSVPFIIPVPGAELPGLVSFRDIRDVNFMIDSAKDRQKAVVIGGGLLGLEAANGLISRGMDVTVVHRNEVLMNVQLDRVAGGLLKKSLEAKGMKFKMSANTAEILGSEQVSGVKFTDGSIIDADLVVMAVGIKPNVSLGRRVGLEINRGILVNDQLQTSVNDIYALGECVEHQGQLYGLVAPLYEQAQVLAEHLVGKEAKYQGSAVSTKLKVTGIHLFSTGDFNDSPDTESLVYKDLTQNIYRKIVLKNNRIKGAVMFGDISSANWIFKQLAEQNDMSAYRDTLVFGEGFEPSTIQNKQKEKVA
ncbi:NAD(P)/FAD-dependent oxidoreductase [Thiomicrorhabdus sp. Kp2]|uniref:NAD(P)/FAD-dependent oxidoreductase n=1 Tax=Thiomicrorhabdus sp. Kp2 TaxID=1123518 RepID=UPI0003F9BA4D|nr:FAD-dependent oxidoreductase [Thiomicrorhabdus sp. Kp2]